MSTSIPSPSIALKWDPKNLEIRTLSVERTLAPLVMQVTTLMNSKESSKQQKGKSVKGQILAAAVQKATENFIKNGEAIANENPDIYQEMMVAVDDVRKTGEIMTLAAKEFADEPLSSIKRANMVRAARNLLSAVTHLLILADMVDVHHLLTSLHVVENDLDKVREASSQSELVERLQTFGSNTSDLIKQAAKRQAELKDTKLRDDLAAARATLQKSSAMLLSATKVYLRHPELPVACENRDFILKQVYDAVNVISDIAQGKPTNGSIMKPDIYDGPGKLAASLNEFDEITIMDPLAYCEGRSRPLLEERLESIVSDSALIADSSCTRNERRERIVAECNSVRQALQDLLTEYLSNVGKKTTSENLDKAISHMMYKTKILRRQLRKAVVDHVSDAFLETSVPLLALIEIAKTGNEGELEEYVHIFMEYGSKLIEVASLACSMSNNEEGVKMVRHAANQIDHLSQQVVSAATILAARSSSAPAQENMESFKIMWQNQVKVLIDAVDDIVTTEDFLAVSESHILEDVNKCVETLQVGDADTLDRTAGAIRGRSIRICEVVSSEMDNFEPGIYTERVIEAVAILKDQGDLKNIFITWELNRDLLFAFPHVKEINKNNFPHSFFDRMQSKVRGRDIDDIDKIMLIVMLNFSQQVELAVSALSSSPVKPVDENEFIDASRLVYDGVREIRRAVLINRTAEELDSETEIEYEEETYDTRSKSSVVTDFDEYPDISGISNTRDAYRLVSEAEKQQIAAQVETFRCEKSKFDREVAKWDDTGNDIIVLAKQMCMIMMEMTDFTRGKGPLKTTMDVINAAKKISGFGTKLDKLARQIADMCPESSTKKDLLAYLQRIALYCHQLNITSKVKADVQNISGNLIVSGIDSATSLIQAAKNLMNAVVLTVKASYVASTKYPRTNQASLKGMQNLSLCGTTLGSKKGLVYFSVIATYSGISLDMNNHSEPRIHLYSITVTLKNLIVWKMRAPEKKPLFRHEQPEEMRPRVRKNSQKRSVAPIKALNEFESPSDSV